MTPRTNHRTTRFPYLLTLAGLGLALAGCDAIDEYFNDESSEAEEAALYMTVPAERRNITVAVEAAGVIEPDTTVEVKSKASGEILSLPVETGDHVQADTLLARIDRRVLNNSLQLAKANLEVAKARLANAESSLQRVTTLYEQSSLSKSDWEQSVLEHATAVSEVVRSEIQVENASIQLDDADVVAPIAGTIIERLVEQGQVISSPMGDVGGGTLLMQMADLSRVQVRMLVDEIDIGKVQPGVGASVSVAAYPNRPFEGKVLKVEPQAVAQQNVTMFPVLIDIENRDGLLKPGMNAEVEVLIARRANALTIPNAALRTEGGHRGRRQRPRHRRGDGTGDAGRGRRRCRRRRAATGSRRPAAQALKARARTANGCARSSPRCAAAKPLPTTNASWPRKCAAACAKAGAGGLAAKAASGAALGARPPSTRSSAATIWCSRCAAAALRRSAFALASPTWTTPKWSAGLDDDDEVLILPSASLVRAQESFPAPHERAHGHPRFAAAQFGRPTPLDRALAPCRLSRPFAPRWSRSPSTRCGRA